MAIAAVSANLSPSRPGSALTPCLGQNRQLASAVAVATDNRMKIPAVRTSLRRLCASRCHMARSSFSTVLRIASLRFARSNARSRRSTCRAPSARIVRPACKAFLSQTRAGDVRECIREFAGTAGGPVGCGGVGSG